MKERPILFSAPMVRAILAGNKTQTRRVVKIDAPDDADGCCWVEIDGVHTFCWTTGEEQDTHPSADQFRCPYGKPGDRLWVRETWAAPHSEDGRRPSAIHCDQSRIHYAASEERGGLLWRPSIHMPRWASRITLEVTGVRVERLQDITNTDALAEGVQVHPDFYNKPPTSIYSPAQAYRDLWESINGPGSWDANPWVWVVEFKRVEAA